MYCSFSGKFLLSNLRTKSEFKLQDVHSTVTKIYIGFQSTLSPNNGVIVSGVLNELVQNLITLKSDPVIKDELDPMYKMFLKEMALKPSRKAQQCILSLL